MKFAPPILCNLHKLICFILFLTILATTSQGQQSEHLYGIHDADPSPQEFLDHLNSGNVNGWVTATVAIGDDPNDHGGSNFESISTQAHTVICRLNYGYSPNGTLPASDRYDEFAQRCANFVQATTGSNIFIIGNETNLAHEWPIVNGRHQYISPQDYADCFALCYTAIKSVKPDAKVIPQALAPFAGPYGEGQIGTTPHDANPLNWVQYMNQMLTAINSSGDLDGIALHINSRGYTYNDIHSKNKVNAGGQDLYFSFYIYKDWVQHGIPENLYHLPLYATECNGIYYWKGGHPENTSAHYESGWIQEIYAEIDRYNQQAKVDGKPIFRCVNLYRWCSWCDDWNIDGCNYKSQILSDLDQAVTFKYSWNTDNQTPPATDLVNGDFEEGKQSNGVGNGWTGFQSTGYTATFDVQTDQVVHGSFAQNILSPQPSTEHQYAGVYQTIAVTNGETYEIQASNRTHFTGGSAWDYIARLGIDLSGGTDFRSSSVTWYEFDSQKDTWHTLSKTIIASDNAITLFLQTWRKWPAGGDSQAWFDNIVVSAAGSSPGNQFPTAVISADPQSGRAPLGVTFDASGSTDPDGDLLTYSWDFGNNNQATGSQVVHTYQQAGTFTATLTVNDGQGGTDQSTMVISVSDPPNGPLDFQAIKDSLNQIGLDLQFVKTGFHVAVGGNARGIGDYMTTLDQAGVPFCIKSVDNAGIILDGAMMRANSGVPHQLIYRRCGDFNGHWMDCPDYNKTPYDAAVEHWQYHMDAFPQELIPYKHLIWIETVNELNKLASDWIGEFCYHTAQMAMNQGFNWSGPSWSTGVPEYEHWLEPGMIQFLELVAQHPNRISVALHEYSLSRDNLDNMYPHLVGRFQMLYQICDSLEIARPPIHITEFGWDGVTVGHSIDEVMNVDIPWAAELYGSYRNVLSAAIWYLGPGFGGIADQAQKLIAPMTEYATQNYFVIPLEDDPINGPPTASFNAYPTQGIAPLNVNFDATNSSDPDNDPLSFSWDFGDQTTGTGQSISHRFEQQGTFTVVLTVGDGNNHSDTSQVQIHVQDEVNDNPVVVLSAEPTVGDAPLQVQFDASGSHDPDGDPLTFSWNFGDGNTATGDTVTHLFENEGEYQTVLEVDDSRGGTVSDQVMITVNPDNQSTNLISNGSFDQNLSDWNIWTERGALNLSVQNGQAHISSSNHNGGLYQQFQTGGSGTDISISGFWASGPTAPDTQWGEVLIINSDRVPENGVDVTGQESDVELIYKNDTFETPAGWSGNLSQTSLNAPSGTFIANGNTACIVIKSGNIGGTVTGLKFDHILVEASNSNPGNHAPVANISATPTSGNAPLGVAFDASGSSDPDGDALTYSWNFGDNSQSTEERVDHVFSNPGTYTVVLTVHDGQGLSHSKSISIDVYDPSNPPDNWELVLEEYWDTMDGNDWYDQNVVQQVRNDWTLWNNTGHNPIGNPNGDEPWNDWGLCETRFGWDAFLPPHEWDLFLNERGFCYKIFAGYRAWHIELLSPSLSLSPGTYRLTLHYHCDSYVDYQDGKIPPGWPGAFQARVHLGSQASDWQDADYLTDNTVVKEFYIGQSGDYQASFEMRNPWAIKNGCAFTKYFILEKSINQTTVPVTYAFDQPGWYMISVPGNTDDMTISALFPNVLGGTGYYYQNDEYVTVQAVEPGKAYWIYIPDPTTVSFDVTPVQHVFYHFDSPGWHMVGCLIDGIDYNNIHVNPADGIALPFLAYDNENLQYNQSSQLDATTGYWVSVLKECDMEIHSGQSLGKSTPISTPAWFSDAFGKYPPPPPVQMDNQSRQSMPTDFCLYQNYPNPFNPETRIEFDLPETNWTIIEIFNLQGKKIKTLINGQQTQGHHSIVWNGQNDNGVQVASGIYWVVLKSGSYSAVQKMTFLK